MNIKYYPYPIESLPDAIRLAVAEYCANTKAPPALVAMAAISAASIAFQGHYNVRQPHGGVRPISLYMLAIAESSGGKSTVMRDFHRAIDEFEARHAQINQDAQAEFSGREAVWNGKVKKLTSLIAKDSSMGKCTREQEDRLDLMYREKPKRPSIVRIIYEDMTFSAILQGLYEDCSQVTLRSSEGAIVFKGLRIQDLPKLCRLWDGDPSHFSRKDERFALQRARLTFAVMTQLGPLRKFIEKGEGTVRELGLLARMLVANPESTIGERNMDGVAKSTAELDRFNIRIKRALEDSFLNSRRKEFELEILELSESAKKIYLDFFNLIEAQLSKTGSFSDVKDCGAKMAENLLRVAAIFHLMAGRVGMIQPDSLELAKKICTWHLLEYQRLFGTFAQISEEFSNKQLFVEFLTERLRSNGMRQIKLSDLYSYAPGKLRKKSILIPILNELCGQGIISMPVWDGSVHISLEMRYFSALVDGRVPLLHSSGGGNPCDAPMVRYGLSSTIKSLIFSNHYQ